ncbi:MAG: NAD(P)H-binding protein [Ferruginibacter sp.]
MIVTIFGGTGMVGQHLVKQALNKEYIVKAFGRNVFTAGFAENKNLHLTPGALFDAKQVFDAVSGSDAVLSALGGAFDGTDKTRSLGMKNIVAQMEKAAVKRIIAVGGMGSLDNEEEEPIMDTPNYPKQFLAVSKEHYKAYEYLKGSSLDWTMLCPPDIINAEATGLYHTAANHLPVPNMYKINAGDLAMCMLNEITKNEYLHQRVGISN